MFSDFLRLRCFYLFIWFCHTTIVLCIWFNEYDTYECIRLCYMQFLLQNKLFNYDMTINE